MSGIVSMGRPVRRPYAPRMAPEARREQLLDVTLGVIAERGYDRVTIDAIAKAAGVTRPVVYGLFTNLDELLHALFQRQEERALAQLARVVPPTAPDDVDPDAMLVEALRGFLQVVAEDPETWQLILLPPESTPGPVRERVRTNRERVLGQIEPLIAWGIERRGGPTGLETELVARTLLGFCEESGRLVLADSERYSPRRLADYVASGLSALGR